MNIIAKMVCETVTQSAGSDQVKLRPVCGDSEENKTFSKYTPAGEVNLTITNPSAIGAFVAGNEYFVRFEPALPAG